MKKVISSVDFTHIKRKKNKFHMKFVKMAEKINISYVITEDCPSHVNIFFSLFS